MTCSKKETLRRLKILDNLEFYLVRDDSYHDDDDDDCCDYHEDNDDNDGGRQNIFSPDHLPLAWQDLRPTPTIWNPESQV